MDNFDYELFKEKLKEVSKQIYLKYEKQNGDDICGFALYSDDSAMSISISMNTYTYLNEQIKEDPSYECDFRFSPEEWKYDAIESEDIDRLSKLLESAHLRISRSKLATHKDRIFNIATTVLEELKQENLFKALKDDFVLLFSMSEFSDTALLLSSFKQLNSGEMAVRYEQWLEELETEDDIDDDY